MTGRRARAIALTTLALALVVQSALAGDTTHHGRVGEYRVIENQSAFMALTGATHAKGGAFSFGCAKISDVCGHLLHFPNAVKVPKSIEHVVFKVDAGAIHIIAAMAYGNSARGSSLVLSDLSLEESSTFAEGRQITFWPGVVSSAMPGGDGSRTFSLAGYRESVRAVRAMKASFVAGEAPPALNAEASGVDHSNAQRSLRRAIEDAERRRP